MARAGLSQPGSDAVTEAGPRIAFHAGVSRPAAIRMGGYAKVLGNVPVSSGCGDSAANRDN
jgi:hypothetical protein